MPIHNIAIVASHTINLQLATTTNYHIKLHKVQARNATSREKGSIISIQATSATKPLQSYMSLDDIYQPLLTHVPTVVDARIYHC